MRDFAETDRRSPSPRAAGSRPPRQARSRRTRERIVEAAAGLLEERSFDEISVAEIALRAGISVGGFYGRFPSKDALLDYLVQDAVEGELAEEADEELAPERTAGRGVFGIYRSYVRLLLAVQREHAGLVRDAAGRAAGGDDGGGEAPPGPPADDRLRELLLARPDDYGHPRPREAVEVTIAFLRAAVERAVVGAPPAVEGEPLDDEALARELARAAATYLEAEPGPVRRSVDAAEGAGEGEAAAAISPETAPETGEGEEGRGDAAAAPGEAEEEPSEADEEWSPFDFPGGV